MKKRDNKRRKDLERIGKGERKKKLEKEGNCKWLFV